jgi:hypothetical protein
MQIFEVLTVGFPFCIFKILTGLYLKGAIGTLFIILGSIDFIINALNLISLMVIKRKLIESCSLAVLVSRIKTSNMNKEQLHDFGNALDMFFAFALVAFMVGFSKLAMLSPQQLLIWNMAVILNVLGAGLSRLSSSLVSLKRP